MRHTDGGARGFGQHCGINRVFWHQIGDELVAVNGIELIGVLKIHAKKTSGKAIPEWRSARLINQAAQLGNRAFSKTRAMFADEEVAAPRDEHTKPARALAGVKKKPADFG